VILRADDAIPIGSLEAGNTASTASEKPALCPAERGRNGACIEGMLLQQS
jgi:hypothetical protein